MGRHKINHPTYTEDKETKYEIQFFKLKSFLARQYPEALDEYEGDYNEEEKGGIVYG